MGFLDTLFGKGKKDGNQPAAPNKPTHITAPPPAPKAPIKWSESPAHLELLSEFLTGRRTDRLYDSWENSLGEPPQRTVARFIAEGVLVPIPLLDHIQFMNSAADLKKLAKEHGLKVSGNKAELAARLLEADQPGMAKVQAENPMVMCAPDVRERVSQYVADKEREMDAAISACLAALLAMDFPGASRAAAAYQVKFPSLSQPAVGGQAGGRDLAADKAMLTTIFNSRPKILASLPDDDWRHVHAVYALGQLLPGQGIPKWLPEGFTGIKHLDHATTLRMLQFYIKHKSDLDRMREVGVTRGTIMGCGDASCAPCRKIADKKHKLDELPELPYEHCTCIMGCRCTLIADFKL